MVVGTLKPHLQNIPVFNRKKVDPDNGYSIIDYRPLGCIFK